MIEKDRKPQEKEKKPQRVCIKFYFSTDDPTREVRLGNARRIIENNNDGTIESETEKPLKSGTIMFTIIAVMPPDLLLWSRKFDQKLNKGYEADSECAGAGEVYSID